MVAVCLWPEAPGLAQQVLEEIGDEFGKTYGVDYAFLGFKPGNFGTAVVISGLDQAVARQAAEAVAAAVEAFGVEAFIVAPGGAA
mgnify:CR=1 FL=1